MPFNIYLVDQWITDSFPIIRMVIIIALVVVALALIAAIMLQPSNSEGGLGAISGQTGDTYFSKNKKNTLEGTMKRLTIILSVAVVVLSIAFFITLVIYPAT